MFVCILFCGFDEMNGTEALVCARAAVNNSSNERDFKSNTFQCQIVF